MQSFGADRPRRRPNLTPMIDVVFLLLVFFMLASRFGSDHAIPLLVAGQGSGYSGPPRLVDITPDGVALNGVAVAPEALAAALAPLTDGPSDMIVLRAKEEASLQAVIAVMDRLGTAGFTRLVLSE